MEPITLSEPIIATEHITLSEPITLSEAIEVEPITFDTINKGIVSMKTQLATMQQQLRALEKSTKISKKEAGVGSDKKQKKITGFCINETLSPELCEFMKLPPNSTSSRIDISAAILGYIRKNKLQDLTDRKNIKADNLLRVLFKLRDDELLTYFNIQRYISALVLKS